jgi:hypothetical protein
LPAEDVEREKRIEMAAAVIVTARNAVMRRRAMNQVFEECAARSAAASAAIEKARAQ